MVMLLYTDSQFTSPYAMSAFVALTEKQLSFEVRTLELAAGANNGPEYARTSLTQRVPTLIDGNFALSESSAIAEYLNDAYPNPPIFPTDLQKHARARQVQAWLRSDFMPIRQERPTPTIFCQPVSAPFRGQRKSHRESFVLPPSNCSAMEAKTFLVTGRSPTSISPSCSIG
jgi:glutathione S-transferase